MVDPLELLKQNAPAVYAGVVAIRQKKTTQEELREKFLASEKTKEEEYDFEKDMDELHGYNKEGWVEA